MTLHAGHATLSHIGRNLEPIVTTGKVLEIAQALREAAMRNGKSFAISSAVFSAAGVAPSAEDALIVDHFHQDPALSAYLTDVAPGSPTRRNKHWRRRLDEARDLIATIAQA